jgi:hypothetical protein
LIHGRVERLEAAPNRYGNARQSKREEPSAQNPEI